MAIFLELIQVHYMINELNFSFQVGEDSLSQIFSTILNWHLCIKSVFPRDVSSLIPRVIAATMDIFNEATNHLLPTPNKCHYTFNLRDFAKVIQVSCFGIQLNFIK